MKFIPTENDVNGIPYGQNEYYCSTMTKISEYKHLYMQSHEVFQHPPTFLPFYLSILIQEFD